jgi:hypothetical protein
MVAFGMVAFGMDRGVPSGNTANAVQPRPDGAQRHVERLCGLLVRQIRPGDQEQQVAFGGRQPRQYRRDPRSESLGGHPFVAGLVERLAEPFGVRLGEQSATAAFHPPVLPDEVGRDAVQPRPGIRPCLVVTLPPAEGDGEGLRADVLGDLGA